MCSEEKMTIDERRKFLRVMKKRYVRADRKTKAHLLDEMGVVTGMLTQGAEPAAPNQTTSLMMLWQAAPAAEATADIAATRSLGSSPVLVPLFPSLGTDRSDTRYLGARSPVDTDDPAEEMPR